MTVEKLTSYTNNLSVLYVEDSATMRHITAEALAVLFKDLDAAKDGVEGYELYEQFYAAHDRFYDIVITDLEMPNMDGKELSQRVLEYNPYQEIIVISSNDNMHVLVELINTGIHKFITKPIEEEQLYDVLYDVAQKIRLKRLEENELKEIAEHNKILKERETVNLKKLEATVQELSEFKKAMDASSIVSKTDLQGTITYVNDKFNSISGYSIDEIIGQNHRILKSGNMSDQFYKKMWNTISSKNSFRGIFENRSKAGDLYYIETLIKPIFDLEGEIVEYISVSHDMTRLKQTLDAERDALKSKDEFFVNISHEMRTPLNAILGFSSVLKNLVKDDPKVLEIVDAIFESGTELNNLVESVLLLRKLKEDALDLKPSPFFPKEEFTKCIARFSEKAFEKEQDLSSSFDPNIPVTLVGDHALIIQAFSAIVDNAVKFTPVQGAIDIYIRYEEKSQLLVCQVQDTGIGIAKEDHAKIFDLEQLDGSFTRSFEGAGLGLSIASEIVHLMKGSIKVESEKDAGAIFTLAVPVSKPPQ